MYSSLEWIFTLEIHLDKFSLSLFPLAPQRNSIHILRHITRLNNWTPNLFITIVSIIRLVCNLKEQFLCDLLFPPLSTHRLGPL